MDKTKGRVEEALGELTGKKDETLRGLDSYEQIVNTCGESTKACWRMWWGPLGEPMVQSIDAWWQM